MTVKKKHRVINDVVKRLKAKLILSEPTPKCEKFGNLIDELVSLFDKYCPKQSFRESRKFSEKELKKLI